MLLLYLEPSRHIAFVAGCQDYRIELFFLSIHKLGSISGYLLHSFHYLKNIPQNTKKSEIS